MTSGSSFSMPSAMAGRESVTRLIQSSWTETKGDSCQMHMASSTTMISAMFVPSRKPTTFLMLE